MQQLKTTKQQEENLLNKQKIKKITICVLQFEQHYYKLYVLKFKRVGLNENQSRHK